MFRLVGASRVVREAVPPELVPVAWAVTLLGGTEFLVVTLSLAYWTDSRRRRELLGVVAVAFVAVAATFALKYWFALPRPPAAVQQGPVDPSPVGFPSGHTIAATVAYGGLLVAYDRHREPRAVAGTAALVALVGLSRVVLGVHYLGDVVAGLLVGAALLALIPVCIRRDDGPAVLFALAVGLSIPAAALATDSGSAALALGGSVGGLAAVTVRNEVERVQSRARRARIAVVGLAFVGAVMAAFESVEAMFLPATGVTAVLVFGVVALPSLFGRFERATRASAGD